MSFLIPISLPPFGCNCQSPFFVDNLHQLSRYSGQGNRWRMNCKSGTNLTQEQTAQFINESCRREVMELKLFVEEIGHRKDSIFTIQQSDSKILLLLYNLVMIPFHLELFSTELKSIFYNSKMENPPAFKIPSNRPHICTLVFRK